MSLKDWALLILFILLLLTGGWLAYEIKDKRTTVTSKTVDSTTTVTKDTTFKKKKERTVKPDTVKLTKTVKDTVVKTEKDTFTTKPDSQENSEYTKIREYETSISDSLITGTIKTTVQGYLIKQNLTYSPIVPTVTINTKTRVVERITKTRNRSGYPSVGLYTETDLRGIRGLTITGSWTFSSGHRITYGYDPVLKTHTVGFSYNLRNLFK